MADGVPAGSFDATDACTNGTSAGGDSTGGGGRGGGRGAAERGAADPGGAEQAQAKLEAVTERFDQIATRWDA